MSASDLVIPILESLWLAKKATELLPELPNGMKPSHIRVLHAIHQQLAQNGSVRVSNVSSALQITKPSITKLINELADLAMLKKFTDEGDKRIVLLELTSLGQDCVQQYVLDYHAKLATLFARLEREKYLSMIDTVAFIHQAMQEVSA